MRGKRRWCRQRWWWWWWGRNETRGGPEQNNTNTHTHTHTDYKKNLDNPRERGKDSNVDAHFLPATIFFCPCDFIFCFVFFFGRRMLEGAVQLVVPYHLTCRSSGPPHLLQPPSDKGQKLKIKRKIMVNVRYGWEKLVETREILEVIWLENSKTKRAKKENESNISWDKNQKR